MKYDVALKELFRHCSEAILRHLLDIPVAESLLLEERPQETTSLRRSDFVFLVTREDGEEILVIIEFQTHWHPNVPERLLEYRMRHKLSEKIEEVYTFVILLRPSTIATDLYEDTEVRYQFGLTRIYEMDAAQVIGERMLCLLPMTPLMRHGVELADKAEQLIAESDLPGDAKSDMFTVMTLLAGLISDRLAKELLNRRRDIMIESAGYALIKQEGWKEGLEKGREEGFEKGREEGFEKGLEKGRVEGYREGLLMGIAVALDVKFGVDGLKLMPELKEIENVAVLEAVEQAIRSARTVDELRSLYRE
ncbi:MAG: hypothetical protein GXP42_10915 [Chloroflexi bacterium]|nr:hypothetical protein [Chloroflexota bacterium]